MSDTISGMVQAITPNNGVSKRTGKPYTIWTVTVDGHEVKAGFKKPGFEVGQNVSLPVATNKWGDVEMIQPGAPTGGYTAPPKPSGGTSAPGGAPMGGRTFPVAKNSPEMSIIRQNALTNANSLLEKLMEHGCTFQDEDQYSDVTPEEWTEHLIKIAYKLTEFSSGQREAKAVESMMKGS